MTRRTFGLLAIAQRHPKLFAAMHHTAKQRSDVEDRSDGTVRANAAMQFDMEAEAALEQLRVLRGAPYRWGIKHLQTDEEAAAAKARRARPPQERRSVRDSRWGNFTETTQGGA